MARKEAVRKPYTTLIYGGGGVFAAGVITLAYDLSISGFKALPPNVYFFGTIVLFLATGILAFGTRGESGIAGKYISAKIALTIFGAGPLLTFALGAIPLSKGEVFSWSGYLTGILLQIVVILAGVISAIGVVRAGRLTKSAKWMLLPIVALMALDFALQNTTSLALEENLVKYNVEVLRPALLLLLGATYLLPTLEFYYHKVLLSRSKEVAADRVETNQARALATAGALPDPNSSNNPII